MIGSGYNSRQGIALSNRCIKGGELIIPSARAFLKYNSCSSYREVETKLRAYLNISFKINLGFFKKTYSWAASYLNDIRDTDYTQSYSFDFTAETLSKKLDITDYGDNLLTQEALSKFQAGKFQEYCGDKVVYKENYGASLYFSIKFEFSTRYEQSIFNAGSQPIKMVAQMLNLLAGRNLQNLRAKVSLHMLTQGIDLKSIQNLDGLDSFIWNEGYGYLNCKSYENCSYIIEKFFENISNIVFKSKDDYVLWSEYKSYNDLGIIQEYSRDMGIISFTDIKKLDQLHEELLLQKQFIEKLLTDNNSDYFLISGASNIKMGWNSKVALSETMTDRLLSSKEEIEDKLVMIEKTIIHCINNYELGCGSVGNFTINDPIYQEFSHAFLIKTKCSNSVFGFRYILPIGGDRYQEISRVKNSEYHTTYQINKDDHDLVIQMIGKSYQVKNSTDNKVIIKAMDDLDSTALLDGCSFRLSPDARYDYIDLYSWGRGIPSNCKEILCPLELGYNDSEDIRLELVYVETPL